MLRLQEELPYGLVVEIEGMGASEDEPGKLVVQAVIWVERAGQKAIVIGKGGELLKEVGRAVAARPQPSLRPAGAPRALGQGQAKAGRTTRTRCASSGTKHELAARRVNLEPAFLLHHYPWRDTSRILELHDAHARPGLGVRAGLARSRAPTAAGGALQPFTRVAGVLERRAARQGT